MATRTTSRRGLRSKDDAPDRRERKHVQSKKKHPTASKTGKVKASASSSTKKGGRKPKTGGTTGPTALPRIPPNR